MSADAASFDAACDPRPFMRHQSLAFRWLQRESPHRIPSERQVLRAMLRHDAEELQHMLTSPASVTLSRDEDQHLRAWRVLDAEQRSVLQNLIDFLARPR